MLLIKFSMALIFGLIIDAITRVESVQLNVGIENDLSKPSFGLQGPTTSQLTYDDRKGLNMSGPINDIFGPPLKIATGFGNIFQGANMAGVGQSLKSNGAIVGIDAKLLEAAGGANLLKGGLLMGGAAAKTGAAKAIAGAPGKKISSVIEVPVKVVAMKDLATGKALSELGAIKGVEAVAAKSKGATLVKNGEALKAQGMNQIMQGAQEGITNIGNMIQQTAGNAASAVKLLPILLDIPTQQQQQQIEQQTTKTAGVQPATGGSLFGGLASLFPGYSADQLGSYNQGNRSPFNLFGNNNYAAVMNTTSPLANLLMNPGLNPFLLPIAGGPLGQSLSSKMPLGGGGGAMLGSTGQTTSYNFIPGLKVREAVSSSLPSFGKVPEIQQQQQSNAGVSKSK